MSYSEPVRSVSVRARSRILAAVVVVSALLVGVVAWRQLIDQVPSDASADPRPPAVGIDSDQRAPELPSGRERGGSASNSRVDAGHLPDGTTVFDDDVAGVANLDSELLAALRQAATDAADDRVEFVVNSGWRSAEYQQQLLDEAVAEYGSREEAARWVATPEKSAHVSGDAVDIGPDDAEEWLSAHGSAYGLCQTYRNEPWHYELHPEAATRDCPAPYADPTEDPRLN